MLLQPSCGRYGVQQLGGHAKDGAVEKQGEKPARPHAPPNDQATAAWLHRKTIAFSFLIKRLLTLADFNVVKSILLGDREHARATKELPCRVELAGQNLRLERPFHQVMHREQFFKWWRQDRRSAAQHSPGRIYSPHFTSRPRPIAVTSFGVQRTDWGRDLLMVARVQPSQ